MTPALLAQTTRPVLLWGQPNVGKSALFNALTGRSATVSNYAGTTVSVSRGTWRRQAGDELTVIDMPGSYGVIPVTDEERIALECLFASPDAVVLHVIDAKNLDRGLPVTLELLDAGLRVVVVANMADEADEQSIEIDTELLARRLGCPVVRTVAIDSVGIDELSSAVEVALEREPAPAAEKGQLWRDEFGSAVDDLAARIPIEHTLPPAMPMATAAAFAIRGSRGIVEQSGLTDPVLAEARAEVQERLGGMPPVTAVLALRRRVAQVLDGVFSRPDSARETFRHRFGLWLAHPLLGLPMLAAVLYFGFYQLVGVFAAGTVVGWLEEGLFEGYINPFLEAVFETIVPWDWLRALFVGEYGVLTLAITYAIALVLPVVGAFFIVFSIVEDSGYLPRLALLCDRLFKLVGLNGRAVITMVLGLGCSTMATVTTRTLESKRERVLANLLLVLTIPCSAQLGLITALLGTRGLTLWLSYIGCLMGLFFVIGFVTSRVLPGSPATFHMEVAPMRMPRLIPVMRKTSRRMVWYFREVVPLFLVASVILWGLDQTDALAVVQAAMSPMMAWIGMPIEAAESFLIGFFRRDFGAAGLFALAQDGEVVLTDRQLLCGSVTLTLFVPCIATFMMMWRERGPRIATWIFLAVTAIAIGVGAVLNASLVAFGWR